MLMHELSKPQGSKYVSLNPKSNWGGSVYFWSQNKLKFVMVARIYIKPGMEP